MSTDAADTDYVNGKAEITIDRDVWLRSDLSEQIRLVSHEFVHPLQYQQLGRWNLISRHLGETLRYGPSGQYDISDELLKVRLKDLNVVDPRFPLEAIANKVMLFVPVGPL